LNIAISKAEGIRRVKFALPQPFEQALSITVEFAGTTLKATGKDRFIFRVNSA
jgi:hypothetical protein